MIPTHEQELLLQSALLQGESALQAWQNWNMLVDFEQDLDVGSYRLLPLVYHNLRVVGINDPVMNKLKGIYRREWYKNQMLFKTIAEVLRVLHGVGIETMILKGAALTLLNYKDYGLRPMSDFDLLVPTLKRGLAIKVLTQADWKPMFYPLEKLTDDFLDIRHSWGFENVRQQQFDLHWHVLFECLYPNSDDDFWASAIPVQVADIPTHALNTTDQLLHICVHGAAWNIIPSQRWIADAMTILNSGGSEINWTRLVSQAEKRRLVLPIRQALTYLCASFGALIPSQVLRELEKIQISELERKFYHVTSVKPAFLGQLPQYWYRYLFNLETMAKTNWIQKMIGFSRYLQLNKAMDPWQLFKWAISKTIVRIGQAVRDRI